MANRSGKAAPSGKMLKITLQKSVICTPKSHKATVEAMGLRRIRHTIELPDTPETRGMILKVRHLVTVQE